MDIFLEKLIIALCTKYRRHVEHITKPMSFVCYGNTCSNLIRIHLCFREKYMKNLIHFSQFFITVFLQMHTNNDERSLF